MRSFFMAAAALFLFSCSSEQDDKATAGPATEIVEEKPGPFPYYKEVPVRPGLTFEVLSWGKGVDSVGGYLILLSDSVKNDFKSLANERAGIISDAWNMDLDNDGNPEVYIEFVVNKTEHDLHVYEYSRNSFQKISFPGLSSRIKKSYAGNDKFIIKNGDLFRSFPIVNSEDTTQKAGALKMLQYKLSGNSFSVDEIEE
ncbi:hypothetical protein IWX76_000856 [Pedobacter sp. CAN_A7]|uniref:hypothetical protein n=1 Tax=Pedobacter sp. CAN_A7 TaxID=2787722 RepID=UPI001A231B49